MLTGPAERETVETLLHLASKVNQEAVVCLHVKAYFLLE